MSIKSAIISICLWTASAHALDWAVGPEVIGHLQRQINPDFAQGLAEPAVFAKMRFYPWVALLEFGYQPPRSSATGDLSISSSTMDLSLWAHYEFLPPESWAPFVGVGIGEYFDRVDTSFAGSDTVGNGQRFRVGLGVGISRSFDWLLLELEGRGELVEESARPELTGIFRAGVMF